MKYPIIPRRILISKRLAQCMHPALPSGVHQKALETYDIIFKCMGTNRLAAELFIYSAGLFPLLANAALNVRSALLTGTQECVYHCIASIMILQCMRLTLSPLVPA